MKSLKLTLLLVLFFANVSFGQEVFTNQTYGFSINQPKDWTITDRKFTTENLKENIKLSQEQLAALLKANNGTVQLVSFFKYDPKLHPGLIPTIKIDVKNNPAKTVEQLKQMATGTSTTMKKYFNDFIFLQSPTIIIVDGIKSVAFIGSYTLNGNDGMTAKVRAKSYLIPHGNYFFQVNLIDEVGIEDDIQLFDDLIKSIKIRK